MIWRILCLLFGMCCFEVAAAAPEATAIVGEWVMPDGSAIIRIEHNTETDSYEGTVVALLRPQFTPTDGYGTAGAPRLDINNPSQTQRQRSVLGLKILSGLQFDDGHWRGGSIYDPVSGRTYRCQLALMGEDFIELRGFVGISLLGRTMYWQRAFAFREQMRALLAQWKHSRVASHSSRISYYGSDLSVDVSTMGSARVNKLGEIR